MFSPSSGSLNSATSAVSVGTADAAGAERGVGVFGCVACTGCEVTGAGCGFGSDGAATLLDRRLLYDPEFRHQRNLAHRDPWQQHRWILQDFGHRRKWGAPLQHFDWDLDAVSSGDCKRRQLPGSDRILALWPRLWLSIRHSEGRWQLPDSILFTL